MVGDRDCIWRALHKYTTKLVLSGGPGSVYSSSASPPFSISHLNGSQLPPRVGEKQDERSMRSMECQGCGGESVEPHPLTPCISPDSLSPAPTAEWGRRR